MRRIAQTVRLLFLVEILVLGVPSPARADTWPCYQPEGNYCMWCPSGSPTCICADQDQCVYDYTQGDAYRCQEGYGFYPDPSCYY